MRMLGVTGAQSFVGDAHRFTIPSWHLEAKSETPNQNSECAKASQVTNLLLLSPAPVNKGRKLS